MAKQSEVRYINYYVSGSLAYQPEKKKAHRKAAVELPKIQKQQKLVIPVDPVAVGGIVIAFALMIAMLCSVISWNQARNDVAVLQDYVAYLQEENASLQHTYTSGYDLEEIREIALNMGMVPAEQVPHIQAQVARPVIQEEPTGWSAVWAFILGMFA